MRNIDRPKLTYLDSKQKKEIKPNILKHKYIQKILIHSIPLVLHLDVPKKAWLPGKPYGLPGPELAGELGPWDGWKPLGSKLMFCGIAGSGACWNGGNDGGDPWLAGNSL